MGVARFEIRVTPPFRLDLAVWALRRRGHNAVDRWDGTSWRRVVEHGDRIGELAVHQEQRRRSSVLVGELRRRGGEPDEAQLASSRTLLTRMLGLDADIWGFYALAEHDRRLSLLAIRFAGMRPPRFGTVFEALVNAVACQQLSLDVGVHLLNRLAARYGPRLGASGGPVGFPGPELLAGADPPELRSLGFSRAKATCLVTLARKVAGGAVDLEGLAALDVATARSALVELSGIGRWSAEYALLRGLGRLEVLPGDDVGARDSLRRRFALVSDAGYEEVVAFSQAWWPYGGLVYFHLLLDSLAAAGHVGPVFEGVQVQEDFWSTLPGGVGSADQGGRVA